MSIRQTVLVIDAASDIQNLVRHRLTPLNVDVVGCTDGESGYETARRNRPDLILLDVHLPGESGFDVCRRLKHNAQTAEIPVIFLTAAEDTSAKVRAFEIGAIDYVTKPFDPQELRARVRSALRQQMLMGLLETQARIDGLTGLLNRVGFTEALQMRLCDQAQPGAGAFAVLYLDLNRFKTVNDSLGHKVGDELLVNVAKRLCGCVRDRDAGGRDADIVARLGGDEFTILLRHVGRLDDAVDVAQRVRAAIAEPITIDGYKLSVETSIGVRICDEQHARPEDILRDSDIAMYEAKAAGDKPYVMYDEQMHAKVAQRMRIESDLQNAIDADELEMFYQPIVSLETGRVVAAEALMRWRHPEFGLVPPDRFIPIAEETGLIRQLGAWALKQSCADLTRWRARFRSASSMRIAVNVSKRQLVEPSFEAEVAATLRTQGLTPRDLTLEVTETNIMFDEQRIVPVLRRLYDSGIGIAMDDFGTGMSSLTALNRFPLKELKIDRSFVQCLDHSRAYASIVQAIVVLAHNLNLSVVAEGIETRDQLVELQALECNHGQGYHFSRPLPASEFEAYLGSVAVSPPSSRVQIG